MSFLLDMKDVVVTCSVWVCGRTFWKSTRSLTFLCCALCALSLPVCLCFCVWVCVCVHLYSHCVSAQDGGGGRR